MTKYKGTISIHFKNNNRSVLTGTLEENDSSCSEIKIKLLKEFVQNIKKSKWLYWGNRAFCCNEIIRVHVLVEEIEKKKWWQRW